MFVSWHWYVKSVKKFGRCALGSLPIWTHPHNNLNLLYNSGPEQYFSLQTWYNDRTLPTSGNVHSSIPPPIRLLRYIYLDTPAPPSAVIPPFRLSSEALGTSNRKLVLSRYNARPVAGIRKVRSWTRRGQSRNGQRRPQTSWTGKRAVTCWGGAWFAGKRNAFDPEASEIGRVLPQCEFSAAQVFVSLRWLNLLQRE